MEVLSYWESWHENKPKRVKAFGEVNRRGYNLPNEI
jgi:hypothetical protein